MAGNVWAILKVNKLLKQDLKSYKLASEAQESFGGVPDSAQISTAQLTGTVNKGGYGDDTCCSADWIHHAYVVR